TVQQRERIRNRRADGTFPALQGAGAAIGSAKEGAGTLARLLPGMGEGRLLRLQAALRSRVHSNDARLQLGGRNLTHECDYCRDEAIPERCPAYQFSWELEPPSVEVDSKAPTRLSPTADLDTDKGG